MAAKKAAKAEKALACAEDEKREAVALAVAEYEETVAGVQRLLSDAESANKAAEEIRKEYPERKLYVMDTLCISGGLGLLVEHMVERMEAGASYDEVIAIGPLIMMKFVTEAVRPTGINCTVSMNPIMIDGTGMCGGCRLTLNVDGKKVTKFACVDGPDFDGYEVDFDEAMTRGKMYSAFERHAHEEACNLFKKEVN